MKQSLLAQVAQAHNRNADVTVLLKSLSFNKGRLHPIQVFVNNRLQHTARKRESRPRSCSELGRPVLLAGRRGKSRLHSLVTDNYYKSYFKLTALHQMQNLFSL